jgi:DNA-binding NarL/FixJ family response regulator
VPRRCAPRAAAPRCVDGHADARPRRGATAEIRRCHPEVHVLVVTTYATDADIYAAIDAGAIGYLLGLWGRSSAPTQPR